MKRILLGWNVLMCWISVQAQIVHPGYTGVCQTAGTYSYHFTDAFSFTGNVACLGNAGKFSMGILSERKWMLKELAFTEWSAQFSCGRTGVGLNASYSGDPFYNEISGTIGLGKNLGRMDIGIQFGWLRAKAAKEQAVTFGTMGLGFRFHVNDQLIAGWELNIGVFGSAGQGRPERAPQKFSMGIGYEWNEFLLTSVTFEKLTGLPVNWICSMIYQYEHSLFFSCGINSNTGAPFIKTGWKKNRISIQIYTVYEPVLGFSPGLQIIWENKCSKP